MGSPGSERGAPGNGRPYRDKNVFQLHGVDAEEKPVLCKKLTRAKMIAFFKGLAPTVIAIEACGSAHYWARQLSSFGHEVKLIAPQLAKPYVKRGKNDAADAEALCEAMSRPTMRFVPVKTADQQAALMLVGMRDRLVRNRTQLANAIRGYAAEFGLTVAKGICRIEILLEDIASDNTLPGLARNLFAIHRREYELLQAEIEKVEARLMEWHRNDECSQRLSQIPSVGPIGASLLMMKTPDPKLFKSGRDFAAWMGLTPKDHSTAGRARPGGITRAGDELLRSVLVNGATAVLKQVDYADIDTLFEKVRGKRMTQCMGAHPFADPRELGRFVHGTMQLARRDGISATAPREQPAMW